MSQTKKCSKCKIEKPLNEYQKDNNQISGIRTDCKECCSIRAKKYYEEHREERIEYSRKYWDENHEECLIRKKEYNKRKKRCDICNIDTSFNNFSTHLKTKKHINNLNNQ